MVLSLSSQPQKKISSEPKTSQTTMLALLRRRQWKKVGKLLESSNGSNHLLSYSCSRCSFQHSLLNICLRYDPPLHVIQNITTSFPSAAFEVDCVGQLPLHHALQNGASLQVIEYLLKLNINAADVRDIFGNTPLHSLFDDDTLKSISSNGYEEQIYILKMIDMFCAIKPSALLVDDMEERSILECVIENEFNYSCVKKVQHMTNYAMNHTAENEFDIRTHANVQA